MKESSHRPEAPPVHSEELRPEMVSRFIYLGQEYEQLKPTARMFGVSKSVMQNLVTDGKVDSFLLRRNEYSRQGVRLVKISSVRAYFEREAAEYKKAKATGELPVVAEKGREVLKANRARRRAQKESAKQQF